MFLSQVVGSDHGVLGWISWASLGQVGTSRPLTIDSGKFHGLAPGTIPFLQSEIVVEESSNVGLGNVGKVVDMDRIPPIQILTGLNGPLASNLLAVDILKVKFIADKGSQARRHHGLQGFGQNGMWIALWFPIKLDHLIGKINEFAHLSIECGLLYLVLVSWRILLCELVERSNVGFDIDPSGFVSFPDLILDMLKVGISVIRRKEGFLGVVASNRRRRVGLEKGDEPYYNSE